MTSEKYQNLIDTVISQLLATIMTAHDCSYLRAIEIAHSLLKERAETELEK
jgi:hypothetical protein